MPNPTGTNLTASVALNTDPITGAPYVWADGDVYTLAQTDFAEGAAPGASFNGLGVENVPHSKLLNKINLIRGAQLADEPTIAALQARNTWTNVQSFTTAGGFTWTVPAGVSTIRLVAIGGGGGGCGSRNSSGNFTSGAGGGAGARAEAIVTVTPGGVLNISVGFSGSGGSPGGNGGQGGDSVVTIGSGLGGLILVDAAAGNGGSWSGSGAFAGGGQGGLALVGQVLQNGGAGSDGQANLIYLPGNGAAGPWGGDGRAARGVAASYQNGAAPGAGGGGCYGISGPGGNGAPGIVILYW